MLAWATMVAVTSAFDVANPLRITLFAAGAAFEGALLAPDPQPRDRVRTLGWAAVVAAVAIVATVALTQNAVWAAVALLVLLMFSSYALRSWSPRVASLALMGAKGRGPSDNRGGMTLQLADSLRRVEDLQAKLTGLALLLGGHPTTRSLGALAAYVGALAGWNTPDPSASSSARMT